MPGGYEKDLVFVGANRCYFETLFDAMLSSLNLRPSKFYDCVLMRNYPSVKLRFCAVISLRFILIEIEASLLFYLSSFVVYL